MRITLNAALTAVFMAFLAATAGAADSVLADATEKRDLPVVMSLLKQGVAVNGPQPDGATALHWAAHWDDLATAKALVAAGANANAANDYGVTPLILAATNGSAEMLGVLLDAGAMPTVALPSGETPLMTAVRSGSVDAVSRLLTGGADANAVQTSKGQTALMWAAAGGKVAIVRALLEGGADANARSKTGFTPLMFGARHGNIEVGLLLLESGADANASADDGSTPLLVATVRGRADLAILLMDRGAKPDGNLQEAGYSPLHWAAARYENPFTQGKRDAPGEWSTITGIPDRDSKMSLIRALLARGANVNAPLEKGIPSPSRFGGGAARTGATPLMVAATAGDAEVMRLLLKAGADPLVRAGDGSTVLMAAAGSGDASTSIRITEKDRIEAVTVALEAGNNIEGEDKKGYRAMHVASGAEFHDVITFLLEKGADLNPVTKTRIEKEGAGTVEIAGQSPLGVVEGTFNGGTYNERPATAEFLRGLGAKSVGRASLETYMKTFKLLTKDGTVPADPPTSQR